MWGNVINIGLAFLTAFLSWAELLNLMSTISKNLASIKARMMVASEANHGCVKLVAVSKMKPLDDVMTAYEAGQRDFGENYVLLFITIDSRAGRKGRSSTKRYNLALYWESSIKQD